ncbi:MAG TPA: ATP-binding protein [Planctomycetota bacterium]|nr:ATP-binding protein [Planctomycetota bacterium]
MRDQFLAHLPHPAWVKDLQGRYVDVNPAFELAHGVRASDIVGRGDEDLVGADAAARARAREQRAVERLSAQISRERLVRDGVFSECAVVRFPILDAAGAVQGVAGIATDTTRLALAYRELRSLQSHLQEARRQQVLATLADGLAHDVGNVLVCITGYVELALQRLDGDPETAELLREALAAAGRARGLLDDLGPGGSGPPRRERVALRTLAEEALRLLAVQAPPSVRLTLRGTAREAAGDDNALLHVLLNLGRNALAAMPAGGELELSLSDRELDAPSAARGELPAGDYAVLAVRDTGCGMDAATQARIFEPYFTTRAGTGHGLGLFSARRTVVAHGGALRVRSTKGRGSTFEVWLPVAEQAGPIGPGDTPAVIRP